MLSKRELFWGYAAQGLNIGAGLMLLPAIVHYLAPSLVGLWFVFFTIAGFVQLMEQAFQPTLARNVAYVHAGARALSQTGVPTAVTDSTDRALLSELLGASQWVYRRIAAAAAALLLTVGTAYIWHLTRDQVLQAEIVVAWVVFCGGNVLSFYYGYVNAFIQGRGDVVAANRIVAASKLVNVVIGLAALALGAGLLGLALATVAGAVMNRYLGRRQLQVDAADRSASQTTQGRHSLLTVLWHNASRFGLVLLGLFLITRANVLVASSMLGLHAAATFGLAVQLLLVLQALASVPLNLASPRLNALRVASNPAELYRRFGHTLALGLCIAAVGVVLLLTLGPLVLEWIGSRTPLPSTSVLVLMAAAFMLELNHGICANLLATANEVPFVRAYVLTGLSIVLLAVLTTPVIGMLGLVLANLCSQLAYNNWKWPLAVSRSLGATYPQLLHDGLRSLLWNRPAR